MKAITVHVAGFTSDPIKGGVSGFNWYPEKEMAEQDYWDTFKIFIGSKQEVYMGEVKIEVEDSYSGTVEEREIVTTKVEEFLEENDWENSFKK